MNRIKTAIEGLLIIEPDVYKDRRGYFTETYHRKRYERAGIDRVFVQDNLSFSASGTLRGLHFQVARPQAKLVQVLSGEVFDVVVDLRAGSATFGRWEGVVLSGNNLRQLYIPEGFAHGFCVLSDHAHFSYKCTDYYSPENEGGILWSDPDIGIKWPVTDPTLSDKDRRLPVLGELSKDQLPKFEG